MTCSRRDRSHISTRVISITPLLLLGQSKANRSSTSHAYPRCIAPIGRQTAPGPVLHCPYCRLPEKGTMLKPWGAAMIKNKKMAG